MSVLTEEELLQQITEADKNIKFAAMRTKEISQELMKAETELLGARLAKQKLVEQLRVLKLTSLDAESGYEPARLREKEIEEFRERLPELLKKIK